MKIFACIFILFVSSFCNLGYSGEVLLSSTPVLTYFSPNGGCTEAVVKSIDESTESVKVQAYSFTSRPIAEALVRAKKRGDKVIIILDKSQPTAKGSMMNYVISADVETYIDKAHAIAHNKIIIIDSRKVITGSFNFTKSAEEKNAENMLVIDSKELANQYLDNFVEHKNHSIKCTN